MDIHVVWFILLGFLLAGYGILDGFDLGVGILHLFAKTDQERRIFMHSIGPIWDGNEVWLVTFGGALFAAFPDAYAVAFSGYYLPFMILLSGLIFRGVSMEFRSKHKSNIWRQFWDIAFFVSSTMISFLFGVAVGDTMQGLPIESHGYFAGTLADVFRPYPLLIGVLAVATCAMHGSIYLYLKTAGELQQRIHSLMWKTFGFFLIAYVLSTIATLVQIPHAAINFEKYPAAWIVVVLNVFALANVPRAIYLNQPGYAFISSSCSILALTFLFGAALFPNLLISSLNAEWSLNIYNASSSNNTLWIMFWIACLGMPFVIAYTSIVYWVFRGKVQLDEIVY
ncbi:MAG: cytochrome d ubiquinol oxidase subunit II [Candidatus Obscuribacterales bacterium]|jgi:cytochrome bd ubiquinol oxidase subunit II|nr:cytochrome d ubiquinol oxidase subunit II [Candidatus Obscuribacterales bacterium]